MKLSNFKVKKLVSMRSLKSNYRLVACPSLGYEPWEEDGGGVGT